jgi:hypothetical protein
VRYCNTPLKPCCQTPMPACHIWWRSGTNYAKTGLVNPPFSLTGVNSRPPLPLKVWSDCLSRWAKSVVWCVTCSTIQESIDRGWPLDGVGAFPAKICRHQHYSQGKGQMSGQAVVGARISEERKSRTRRSSELRHIVEHRRQLSATQVNYYTAPTATPVPPS